ncbi:MAG: hypothetical protein II877_01950 [Synergistaceae bacterium]|nr:hypothetical protein [Synergistaceae bacterium]MBR0256474.1 hypothetical protein [Synergistaceae bacterium]
MFNGEDFLTLKGVTLSRETIGERNLWVRLFLYDAGLVSLTSKNFMGDSEPFVWAYYDFQKKTKSRNYFLADIDVKDDMLQLRRSRESLTAAFEWVNLITKYLPPEHPDNDLLTLLYWNMRLLAQQSVPCYVSRWRFIWQWLELWGLAPDIVAFHTAKSFRDEEISLLVQVSSLNVKGVMRLLACPMNENVRENVFVVAEKLALGFLDEI